ncbi:hypothetical protein KIN20_018419 [Parelaphostrongylus tenuis]|uniref:Uncharacterized protein n=1 Tax=Parelaphostrongylus tenuis TaxID=148309 RepID=A0AAD5MJX7_PARTN|nr:hypothetical protein KIN20_018419 [Parelaphostrongylus tenuis]
MAPCFSTVSLICGRLNLHGEVELYVEKRGTKLFSTLLMHCCSQPSVSSSEDIGTDYQLVVEQFVKQHDLPVSESQKLNLSNMEPKSWLAFAGLVDLVTRQAVGVAGVVPVVDMRLISNDDRLGKALLVCLQQKTLVDVHACSTVVVGQRMSSIWMASMCLIQIRDTGTWMHFQFVTHSVFVKNGWPMRVKVNLAAPISEVEALKTSQSD